jgi:Zn-dependent oligopeptidase
MVNEFDEDAKERLIRIDERTAEHSRELKQISLGMSNLRGIEKNTATIAASLEKVTDRALTSMEKQAKAVPLWTYIFTVAPLAICLVLIAIAWTRTSFTAQRGDTKIEAGPAR